MKKLDEQAMTLLEKEAAGFISAVEKAKKENAQYVILNMLSFASESEAILLHICLRYAYEQGIAVLFAPGK